MLRDLIIQRFIENDEKIIKSIGHNFSVQFKPFFGIIIKLGVLYAIYYVLQTTLPESYLDYTRTGVLCVSVIFFAKYCISFLNLYLDALVFTRRGVKLFVRESILKHKVDEFDREHIQVVSSEQNTLWDKIFNRGDMHFALTNNFEFPFVKIHNPQRTVNVIYKYKDLFLTKQGNQQQEEQDAADKEKFNLLVESLGDVITDYMKKKGNNYLGE